MLLYSVSSVNRLKTPYSKTFLRSGEYKEVVMHGDRRIRLSCSSIRTELGLHFLFWYDALHQWKIQLYVTGLTFFFVQASSIRGLRHIWFWSDLYEQVLNVEHLRTIVTFVVLFTGIQTVKILCCIRWHILHLSLQLIQSFQDTGFTYSLKILVTSCDKFSYMLLLHRVFWFTKFNPHQPMHFLIQRCISLLSQY